MNTQTIVPESIQTTRAFTVGRAWINEQRSPNSPAVVIRMDRDLPRTITLAPGSELIAFPNVKRDGKQDADFRIAVRLPREVADTLIAEQRATREAAKPATPVATVAS